MANQGRPIKSKRWRSERLLDVLEAHSSLSLALVPAGEHLWPLQCATMNGGHRQRRSFWAFHTKGSVQSLNCIEWSSTLNGLNCMVYNDAHSATLIPLKSLNKLRHSNCSNLQFVRSGFLEAFRRRSKVWTPDSIRQIGHNARERPKSKERSLLKCRPIRGRPLVRPLQWTAFNK